jgi:hypothetical protein
MPRLFGLKKTIKRLIQALFCFAITVVGLVALFYAVMSQLLKPGMDYPQSAVIR